MVQHLRASASPNSSPIAKALSSPFAYVTTIIAVGAIARSVLPHHWLRDSNGYLWRILEQLNPYDSLTIQEFKGGAPDALYENVQTYLSSKGNKNAKRLLASLPKGLSDPLFTMADDAACEDRFNGIRWHWSHTVQDRPGTIFSVKDNVQEDNRSFVLKVRRKHKLSVRGYLAHVRKEAARLKLENQALQVFSNLNRGFQAHMSGRLWDGQPFLHPSTFDTLVLDHALKSRVLARLVRFKQDADFYRRTGRAHKLGIFLHGPPGTGKTSLIAAIANYMQFSIYDLDLTGVSSNMELRGLLHQISDRAVVVLEDIDTVGLESRNPPKKGTPGGAGAGPVRGAAEQLLRSMGLGGRESPQETPKKKPAGDAEAEASPAAGPEAAAQKAEQHQAASQAASEQPQQQRRAQPPKQPPAARPMMGPFGMMQPPEGQKVTLGGVLNFVDGLRSACGDQRIFIFTTNFPEVLDSALLRPGRMDLHIELSYCTAEVFEQLCQLYLSIERHQLLPEAMRLISEEGVKITPADVTGILDADMDNPTAALQHAIKHMRGLQKPRKEPQQLVQ